MGYSGATNYLTGGASYATTGAGSYGSDSTGSSQVESMLSQSYANQSYLILVQGEMSNLQTQTSAISNSIAMKASTEKSIINNFRPS
jgi:hypothetical protein